MPELPYYCRHHADFFDAGHWLNHECVIPAAWFDRFITGPYGELDLRHAERQVTTTSFCASCPRRSALKQLGARPIVVGPQCSTSVGHSMHTILAEAAIDSLWTEDRTDLIVHGTIADVPVSGKLDAIIRHPEGDVTIIDYKVRNPLARKKRADRPDDDVLQAVINMDLARQSGYNVRALYIKTLFFYEWEQKTFAPWPGMVDDILATVPEAGGTWMTGDLLSLCVVGTTCESVAEVLRCIPPVGESMYAGKMCPLYCQYDLVCHPTRTSDL